MFDRPTRAVLFGRVDLLPKAYRSETADLTTTITKSNGRGIMPVPISHNGFSYIKVPGRSLRDEIEYRYRIVTDWIFSL